MVPSSFRFSLPPNVRVYIRHLRAEEAMSQLDGLYAVFGGLSTKEGRGCGKSINKQVHVRWMEIGQINIRYN